MAKELAAELDYRPSYRAAGIAGAAVLLLYLITLAPSSSMWDTSEYISAAYTLGIPHPPGNPMFVLLGRFFSILPIAPNVAMRVNVLAAVCSAASAALWFLVTERVLVGWFPQKWQRLTGAALAAAIGATAFTDWNQSVVNEKVYTVALLSIAVISWLMVRWCDNPDGPKADRLLVLVAYFSGLGYGVHMAGMLAAPAALVAVLVRRPATVLRWKLLLAVAGGMFLGFTPFATQPIRAAFNPPIDEGEPTACRDGLHMACTFSSGTYTAFMYNFDRKQYGKPDLSERQAPLSGQMGMWWYYFKWQWMRDPYNAHPFIQSSLAALFFVLGLFGGWVHFRRERSSFWYFGTFMLTTTIILIYYLNFKIGATQPGDYPQAAREVRDRDYFFLWSFSAWGVWAGLGLMFIWESVAAFFGVERVKLGGETMELPTNHGLKVSSWVLAIAAIPLFTNFAWAPRWHQTDTLDFAHDLLDSVEPYGVLVTVGDNDTFPLWYAQEVEHIRQDVVVANTSLLNTDWYGRQLVRRQVFDYDAAKGPAVYRNQTWVKPARGPLNMTLKEVDAVPEMYPVSAPTDFDAAGLHATIYPDSLDGPALQRADILVLRMIRDAWPQRPIYFAKTAGAYPAQLGLGKYMLEQGLASKLIIPPTRLGKDTIVDPQGGYLMDVPRSTELWLHDFRAPAALIRRGSWIDEPSRGIPILYVLEGFGLYQGLVSIGDTQDAHSVYQSTYGVAAMLRMQQSLGPELTAPPPAFLAPHDTAKGSALIPHSGAKDSGKTAAPSKKPPE